MMSSEIVKKTPADQASLDAFLSYEKINEIHERYHLDLGKLYSSDAKARSKFEERWPEFYLSDPTNSDIFEKKADLLTYKSELLIPDIVDERPPLLLIFGNPAPHSVKSGMFFSYEGSGNEHRIWRVLNETGIVAFDTEGIQKATNVNEYKRDMLLSLNYSSNFRIGLAPFYSMASPASEEPWTGISGLRRLFGSKILDTIAQMERIRILDILSKFMPNGGSVLAFQKDAYSFLKNPEGPDYSKVRASQAELISTVVSRPDIQLACSPPTRLIHTKKTKLALNNIMQTFIS